VKTKHLFALASCLLTAVFVTGCGTMKIPPYTGGPTSAAVSRENKGLVITADPWSDRKKVDTYFKADVQKRGLALIYLRAENKSTNANWLVNERSFHLVDAAGVGGDVRKNKIEGEYGGAEAVGWTGASIAAVTVVGGLVMVAVSSKLLSDASVMEKNIVDKEWRNQTLAPGQSAEGFLYFDVGKKTNWVSTAALRLDCLNTRNQQTSTLIVPLAHESN
jgi:hypothetical protein